MIHDHPSHPGGRHVDRSAGRANLLTGAAGTPPPAAPPPGYRDWPTLAETAAQLLTNRQRRDPVDVAAGRLAADRAAHRLAVAQALAAQWRAVIEHRDAPADALAYLGEWGALPADVLSDIAATAVIAANRAMGDPNDTALNLAGACAALAWWQAPVDPRDDVPRLLRVHAANQQARAARSNRPAASPAPLPARPPLRQPAQRAMI